MSTLFLAFALQCLFPIFDLSSEQYVGISTVNTDVETREFTVSVTSSDGTSVQRAGISLEPAAQRAFLLTELLSSSKLPSSGWIQIDSATPAACAHYLTTGGSQTLAGTDAARMTLIIRNPEAAAVVLPHIEIATGFREANYADTDIALVNPGRPANVNAQLVGLDGVVRGSIAVVMPASSSRVLRVSDAFREFLPDNIAGGKSFQGYVRLTAGLDEGIAAWQRIQTPLSDTILRGKRLSDIESTSGTIVPHFVFGSPALYESILNLLNPTSAAIDLELTAHDDRGNSVGDTARVSLGPGEGKRATIGELFHLVTTLIFPPPMISGYVRIRETQGRSFRIVGDIEIFTNSDSSRNSALLYPISDAAAPRWTVPFAYSASPYFTGYAVVNPNELVTFQTDVTVEIIGPHGTMVETHTVSLSPKNRKTMLISSGLHGGYLRFSSYLPIHVFLCIGTYDGKLIEQLPAVR